MNYLTLNNIESDRIAFELRNLINEKEYIELKKLPKSINGLIKFTNLKLKE